MTALLKRLVLSFAAVETREFLFGVLREKIKYRAQALEAISQMRCVVATAEPACRGGCRRASTSNTASGTPRHSEAATTFAKQLLELLSGARDDHLRAESAKKFFAVLPSESELGNVSDAE
jgi:hypothetical protein